MEDLEGLIPGEMSYKTLTRAIKEKKLKGEIFTYITSIEVLLSYLKSGRNQEAMKKAFIFFIENDKHTFIPHMAKYFDIHAFLRSDIYGKHGYYFLFSGISIEMITALLQNGYDANGDIEVGERKIFSYVCVSRPQYLRLFLENGADINNAYGGFPVGFHVLVRGNEQEIRTIIEFGFDFKSRSSCDASPYSICFNKPNFETFNLLRGFGVPVEKNVMEKLEDNNFYYTKEQKRELVNYFTELLVEQHHM